MVTRETLESMARQLGADVPIPAEDWEVVVPQVRRMLDTVRTLDELPLGEAEPASIYRVVS